MGTGALPGKSASAGVSGGGFGSDSDSVASTSKAGISDEPTAPLLANARGGYSALGM